MDDLSGAPPSPPPKKVAPRTTMFVVVGALVVIVGIFALTRQGNPPMPDSPDAAPPATEAPVNQVAPAAP